MIYKFKFINNNNLKLMAEQGEGQPYKFTKEGGEEGKNSRDYSGRGYAVYPNNDQYDGQYNDGVREGKGKYVYANGDKYEGDFRSNMKHGIGKLTYAGKGEYNGQWENGHKHGEGTYMYANGDCYSGWWQFNKKHGQGTYVYAHSGMKLVGSWVEGQMDEGKWVFENGTCYSGKFKNNKPSGEGVWYINNGNTLAGNYSQTVVPNEDPEDAKVNLKLDWQSHVGISDSAWEVNAHENV